MLRVVMVLLVASHLTGCFWVLGSVVGEVSASAHDRRYRSEIAAGTELHASKTERTSKGALAGFVVDLAAIAILVVTWKPSEQRA
ncbi:MAG: hypothetical protein ABI867_09560 [Kofleriaceae bacterium]